MQWVKKTANEIVKAVLTIVFVGLFIAGGYYVAIYVPEQHKAKAVYVNGKIMVHHLGSFVFKNDTVYILEITDASGTKSTHLK